MDTTAFFDGWSGPLRSLVVGTCAYLVLLLWLRVSGKRTLSKWNAFDFAVTVAFGSTLATILLSRQTPLADGAVALGTLVLLQFVITWLSVRFGRVHRLVKSEPIALLVGGRLLHDVLRRERVTASEVRAAVRQAGLARLEEVAVLVLETNGRISVLRDAPPGCSALEGVKGLDAGPGEPQSSTRQNTALR